MKLSFCILYSKCINVDLALFQVKKKGPLILRTQQEAEIKVKACGLNIVYYVA